MERKIVTTADGSKTIHISEWDEQYHSKHGAIQEAYHVFIERGLHLFKEQKISILEIGFGTGLNALITFLEAPKRGLMVDYWGVEAFPVSFEELEQLNYVTELDAQVFQEEFMNMHRCEWEKAFEISASFTLTKQKKYFSGIDAKNSFDLIYFDAFGARVQPELWTETIFEKMYTALHEGGFLVTYAAKGSVRRALQSVGFTVERLPGPPGKREMLRANK